MKVGSEWQDPHISGIAWWLNLPTKPLAGLMATAASSELGSPPGHPAQELPRAGWGGLAVGGAGGGKAEGGGHRSFEAPAKRRQREGDDVCEGEPTEHQESAAPVAPAAGPVQ